MTDFITISESLDQARDNLAFLNEEGVAETVLGNLTYTYVRLVDQHTNGDLDNGTEDFKEGALHVLGFFSDAINAGINGIATLDLTEEQVAEAEALEAAGGPSEPSLDEFIAFLTEHLFGDDEKAPALDGIDATVDAEYRR